MSSAPKVSQSTTEGSTAVALLPGMALNGTIFPDTGFPAIEVDFTTFVPDGADRHAAPPGMMARYAVELDRRLDVPLWRDAAKRLIVAHSFGGMLALAWWLRHRGTGLARVDGLVLVSTTAGPMFRVVRARMFTAGRLDLRVPLAGWIPFWNRRSVTRGLQRLLGGTGNPVRVDFAALRHQGDIAVGLAGWRGTDWRARRGHRFAMRGYDVRERLREVPVRTIVLHGTHDRLFSTKVARDLADRLPAGTLRIVPGAGHLLPLTHAHEVVRAVRGVC